MNKPKEFYVDSAISFNNSGAPYAWKKAYPDIQNAEGKIIGNTIHVIEYSYATKLEEENKRLRDALEFYKSYADCSYSCSSRRDSWILRCSCGFEKKDREMRKALSGETKE